MKVELYPRTQHSNPFTPRNDQHKFFPGQYPYILQQTGDGIIQTYQVEAAFMI